jgi:hypothetical protein
MSPLVLSGSDGHGALVRFAIHFASKRCRPLVIAKSAAAPAAFLARDG